MIEICCHSFLQEYVALWICSVIYLFSGVAIAGYAIGTRPIDIDWPMYVSRSWIYGLILLIVMIAQDVCKPLFDIWPMDYKSADMLPVIEIMVERFLTGSPVYDMIPHIWEGMQPIYLPGLWMPYIFSDITGSDMRWIGIWMLLIGTLAILRPWIKNLWTPSTLISIMAVLLMLWMTWLYLDQIMIALTEEGVVIAYYALLCVSLISRRTLFIGLALGLCMMSRYMLAPWAVMLVVAIGIWERRSQAYKIVLSAGLTILILMTVGQGWSAISVFARVPDNYVTAVLSDHDKYAPLIDSSLGIAKFWHYQSLGSLHLLMKVLAIVIPLICIAAYRKWFQNLPFVLFGLISLKLSLVFFYNLLVMPYSYLFYTSTIVSVAILGYLLTRRVGSSDISGSPVF